MTRFFIIFILCLFFVVAGTVVCFFVHFLICPLCCLVCYVKYFPLFGGCLTVHFPREIMWNANLMQHQYINKITSLHQVGISHYLIFLYLVNFLVCYSLEYDFSGSTTVLLLRVISSLGFFFFIIHGLRYSCLLILVLFYTWNAILFYFFRAQSDLLITFVDCVVILMVDGIGAGPEFPRCCYRSLVAR